MAATAPAPLRFVVYSDPLCPWCANAWVRLGRIAREEGGAVRFEWRAYLLRPQPRPPPPDAAARAAQIAKFQRYTQSWARPAAEPDAHAFRIGWPESGPLPPRHSAPAQQVAKAAAREGDEAFARLYGALLRAYFVEHCDISDDATLAALWREVGLPQAGFAARDEPAIREAVLADHAEALSLGATGVPAVRRADDDAVIVGAHPVSLYRRWIERLRARAPEATGRGART